MNNDELISLKHAARGLFPKVSNPVECLPLYRAFRVSLPEKGMVAGLWSGKESIPNIGATITVTINKLGKGTVQGYFVAEGYLGIKVLLLNPPKWWKQQPSATELAHVFGAEIETSL